MILLADDQWQVRQTPEKGRGIFAAKMIAAGTVIGDYIGRVIDVATENTREAEIGMYLMYYHDRAAIYPEDLEAPGMHLINHSCEPNCWMYVYQGHTLFFALRDINPGEELTVSYLLAPDVACDPCVHQCKCGLKNCTKTMHLSEEKFRLWRRFAEVQSKQTKRKRISYGKTLASLDKYPQQLPYEKIYDLMRND